MQPNHGFHADGVLARELTRPEMDRDVPDIANAIYDANWKGMGNWSFNTAYAGSYQGVRAYVYPVQRRFGVGGLDQQQPADRIVALL